MTPKPTVLVVGDNPITEWARDPVSVLTPDGIILDVNHRWEELLQRSREQIVGRPLRDFMVDGPTDGPTDGQSKGGRQSMGGPTVAAPGWKASLAVRRADDSIALLDVSHVALDIGGEQVVLAVARDITEQARAQEQLMMSDRMASLGLLAAGVAHEINNPLAAVIANLDLVAMEVQKPWDERGQREIEDELRDAREAAERVSMIARDLKLFARADPAHHGAVDVSGTVKSALRMASNEIRQRARVVTVFDDVPKVSGNTSRLGQVFLNLLINAALAIPEGHAEDNEIRVTVKRDADDYVVVEVADTGPGILPEVLKHLFTPFFTTKPFGVGTGLGLAICQRVVSAAGGTIGVETAFGKGTTFTVRLPYATADVAAQAHEPPAQERGPRRARVLVIDDEPIIIRAVERTLARHHLVSGVTSAAQALERIKAGEHFDVILCDLMMPGMTGIDLHQVLADVAPDQAARMVFLTGGAFTSPAHAFLDQISNPRLDKPFDAAGLLALIDRQLG